MKQVFIAGPCVIESAELLDTVAAKLVDINQRLGIGIPSAVRASTMDY